MTDTTRERLIEEFTREALLFKLGEGDIERATRLIEQCRTALTTLEAAARAEERQKVAEELYAWTSTHYSRSAAPIYAHVDLAELATFTKALTPENYPANPPQA